ncbi:MAG: hypothetical protein U5J64_07975 [Halobacteriales archaeon]|nr:hypothetical protein [Halobacteriales archaeon]
MRLYKNHFEYEPDEEITAPEDLYSVEVRPPEEVPQKIGETVRGIQEYQTKWLKTRNISPVISFEILRPRNDKVSLRYIVPTKRLERRLRTHIKNDVEDVELADGETEIPLNEEEAFGGGLLSTGEPDYYPLRTDFDVPPMNSVIAPLHRHAMRDTKVLIQVLFQPSVGKPVRSWWWVRRAYKRIGFLRKRKEKLWNSRPPTPREKRQADAIERKAGSPRFTVSIRLLVVGAEEYTKSRLKEISGGFNVYENHETGQHLNLTTVKTLRDKTPYSFIEALKRRRFAGWSRSFQASVAELSGLVSLPEPRQENIREAQP